jgi:hypothetical protein
MSIYHLTNDQAVSRQKIYIQSCECSETMKIAETLEVRDLFFDAQNGDKIELSSVSDKGVMGSVLKSNGNGTVQWGSDLTGGVNYTGTQPTIINQLSLYNSTDGSAIKNSTLVEQDLLDTQAKANTNETDISNLENDKLNIDGSNSMTGTLNLNSNNINNVTDISCVNANFSSTTNSRGQLNYAKNGTDTLNDVGRWVVSDGIKGLILDNSLGGTVRKKFYTPSTSDEARTVTVTAGSGILNLSANTTNDIKTAFVSFPLTDIIVPANSVGKIRVSSTGVVSFSTLGSNVSRFFVLAEVATDTDSLLFIDNKRFISTNYHNNVYANNLNIGSYFIEGTVVILLKEVSNQ